MYSRILPKLRKISTKILRIFLLAMTCLDDDQCHFAFHKRKHSLVPANSNQPEDFFLAYDDKKRVSCLYRLRKCTRAEFTEAMKDIDEGSLEYSTPSIRSSQSSSFQRKLGAYSSNWRSSGQVHFCRILRALRIATILIQIFALF